MSKYEINMFRAHVYTFMVVCIIAFTEAGYLVDIPLASLLMLIMFFIRAIGHVTAVIKEVVLALKEKRVKKKEDK